MRRKTRAAAWEHEAKSPRMWTNSPEVAERHPETRPKLFEHIQHCKNSHAKLAEFAPYLSEFVRNWPTPSRKWPNAPQIGRIRSGSGRSGPTGGVESVVFLFLENLQGFARAWLTFPPPSTRYATTLSKPPKTEHIAKRCSKSLAKWPGGSRIGQRGQIEFASPGNIILIGDNFSRCRC